jgi:hypothetical protein
MLADLGLATTGAACVQIRRGDPVSPRRRMLRGHARIFAAVTLRIRLPACLAAGVPSGDACPSIARACGVPDLLAAKRWFLRPTAAPRPDLAV